MSDDNRVDLSNNLDQLEGDLLKDIHAAAEEVKKRQESDKAKEIREAKKAKSNKSSALIIGIAAVALIVIAYFVVFAKPDDGSATSGSSAYTPPKITVNNNPPAQQKPAVTPVAPMPTTPGRHDSQITNQPKDSYEQPSDNGM